MTTAEPARRNASRKKKFVLLALFLLLTLGGHKAYQYAAPPAAEKDCSFVYPLRPDQLRHTNVSATPPAGLVFAQRGGTINDASCLNRTSIYGVVAVETEDDIRAALRFARENGLRVTPAGRRHSMGGQSFVQDGLVLDMRGFNKVWLDRERKVVRAQSGATWAEVQQLLDREGLAMIAVQSINIFTVGGTLSVNAHGIAHDPGQIAPTARSMRVMTSDGEIHTASPSENAELFRHVLGGYGLFGVILDADLSVTENEMYVWRTDTVDYRQFPDYFAKNIAGDANVGLLYGRLSISPGSFLTETLVHRYERVPFDAPLPPVRPPEPAWPTRLAINLSKTGNLGRRVRWWLEKRIEPKLHVCSVRKEMEGEERCLVTRNQEMYDSMEYLRNRLPDTDILQEYFVPHHRMPEFIDGLRDTVQRDGANLVNVTIRIITRDTVTALPYAREDMFAFVIYFNQGFNEHESAILQKTTTDLIDLATRLGGTFYLPYQLYYSPEQLWRAYPDMDAFFATKRRLDPTETFTNTFYEKYGRAALQGTLPPSGASTPQTAPAKQ